jgi:hypothetical protein
LVAAAAAVAAAALLGALGPAACATCNDVGCGGGLELRISAAGALTAGDWKFELQVGGSDGDALEVLCTIGDSAAESECVAVESGGWRVVAGIEGEDGDADAPAVAVAVRIVTIDPDAYTYEGPDGVDGKAFLDDLEVATESFAPEYDRSFHRGAETCGHCDSAEAAWVLP